MTDDKTTTSAAGLGARIWRSIFRGPIVPRDDRDRKRIVFNTFVLHFRPIRVREATIRYSHTWGLGGSSLVLFLILVITGVLLMFAYEPSPGSAYASVASLELNVFFGKLVRNIHHWSANFLIVFLMLHTMRVYLTGAYYPPRQFNWVIGLSLFGCVLLSNFTGYLLPWDQLSYWATTIVTGMIGYVPVVGAALQDMVRGGREIGAATLVNFYAAHTTVIPVLIIALMAFHFWRVRKSGGVVVPRSAGDAGETRPEGAGGAKPDYVLALPHLVLREFAVALALVAAVMVVALVFDAGLGDPANPGMSPNPAKAPWYFVGFQELLFHFDPVFAVVVIPLLALFGLLLIPYLRYDRDTSGVLLMSHEGRWLALLAAVTAFVATPVWVVADEFWIDWGAWLPGVPPVIANGLLPTVILVGVLATFYSQIRRRGNVSNNEAVQALVVLAAVGFAVLTIIGVWFRGEGMALVWPWNL